MPKIDVEEQLKLRFLQPLPSCVPRRVVVWHDADGEFVPEFERLAAVGFDDAGADGGVMPAHGDFERPVRFVEACEGCMFAVKKLINRDDLASDILLYRRCPRGRLEGDWLADVELYADWFQADYLSLLADQLGIENIDAVRESLRERKTFFDAKTRCAKFAACVPHASGASDIELGILTVIFGGKEPGDARPAFVLRGCMTMLLHEGPEALVELADKYCVRDALSAFIVRCYGFDGPLYERDSLLMLASHVLLTAASTALPEGALKGLESYVAPAYGPYCLEAVRTWDQAADTQASSEDLFEICRLVEDVRGLFARFEALPIDVLASLDVFPCVNEAVLSQLFSSFAQGADRVEDARAFAARRCDLSWYRRVESYFDLLVTVADMCAFRQAHAAGSFGCSPSRCGMPIRPIGIPWMLPIAICAPRICGRAPLSAMCSRSPPALWRTGRRISTATGSWRMPMPAGQPLRKGSGPIAAASMALHGRMSSTGMCCPPLWALPKRRSLS